MDERQRGATAPLPEAAAYAAVSSAYDAVSETCALQLPDSRAEADLDLAVSNHVIASLTGQGDGLVLNAGCGTGGITRYLANRGCTVEGVDVSRAWSRCAPHADLTFAVASITDLPHRAATFAGVVL